MEKLWGKIGEPGKAENVSVEIYGDLWRSFGEMAPGADIESRREKAVFQKAGVLMIRKESISPYLTAL